MPIEYGQLISTDDQFNTSYQGLLLLQRLLSSLDIPTTLFVTGNFASHFPGVISDLSNDHEIASHTFYHSCFKKTDLVDSKICLERITGKKISGLRMPRMKVLPATDLLEAGYHYDASVNPFWLPGRYNNWNKPRTLFREGPLFRIPASVSTFARIPLFWLSFKNLPYALYLKLALSALKRNGYISLYFHPWEFIELKKYKMPFYTKAPCGILLLKKLERLLIDLKQVAEFRTMNTVLSGIQTSSGTISEISQTG